MTRPQLNIVNFALYGIFFLFTFWIAYTFIYGRGGIVARRKIEQEIELAVQEIEKLNKESQRLQWEIQSMKNNSLYLESFARELGYRKEGDIVFRFIERKSNKK